MTVLYYFFLFLFLFTAVILCFFILIQESKSSGLGASFGSGDAGDSLFGTSTPQVLKKITAWLSLVFMAGCIILSMWTGTLGRAHIKKNVATEVIEP